MGEIDDVRIETLGDHEGADVKAMLVDLALVEQRHYDHPAESADQLSERLRPAPHFTGENHILVARAADGGAVGLCWIVLFDPGTGLEAEVAELYVRPEGRRQGVGHRLMAEAMELLRRRQVTFACVWTRGDNPAALAAYQAAGFAPTEQTVLTWLPLA
jgi:ribosomal protein S18 acetylase RimI-like enzyme